MYKHAIWLVVTGLVLSAWSMQVQAADKAEKSAAAKTEAKWAPAVKPKPLSDNVHRGLQWLVKHQLESGAWGQGEESVQMGGGAKMKDVQSVADTCIAATALVRSGSSPSQGPHETSLRAAVKFVCSEVEQSDADSLYITKTRGTRVQGKLGPYIDTFMACMLLSEVQEKMPNDEENERVSIALDKVLHKMQKNQKEDGTWDNRGWAATLSQSVAVKGLNRAAQAGRPVSDQVRERAEEYSRKQFDKKSKSFSKDGAAGVSLYGAASSLGALQESVNTNDQEEAELNGDAPEGTPAPPPSKEVQDKLERFKAAKEDLAAARKAVVEKLQDKRFVAGFGSNGGEEFLSYMSIGESLVVAGGEDWEKWDKAISENLNRIQNEDGSWTGHHCITGRTFCTSAALLVLMVDRTPVPIAAKMKRG